MSAALVGLRLNTPAKVRRGEACAASSSFRPQRPGETMPKTTGRESVLLITRYESAATGLCKPVQQVPARYHGTGREMLQESLNGERLSTETKGWAGKDETGGMRG